MRQLSLLYTGNQQCYSVRYSPFDNSLLACVSCDKFGNGASSLYVIQLEERAFLDSKFSIVESFKYNSTMYDVEWSPLDPTLLLTGNGDGSVAVWQWDQASVLANKRTPLHIKTQHSKEVYSVNWEPSGMRSYHFLSASWDQSIKIWNVSNSELTCLTSLSGHQGMVYAGAWNPKMSGVLLSTSADKTFRLWDVNASSINSAPIFVSEASKSDVLCCDWNKFDPNVFILGYASGLIELRDFRNLQGGPLKTVEAAHEYAIRKIRFSPHMPQVFGSTSYDMTTKVWHTVHGLVDEAKNHSEFAYGFDFDSKLPNRLADCGWDRRVVVSEFDLSESSL